MELRRFIILAVTLALVTVGAVLLIALPKPEPLPPGAQTVPYLFSVGESSGVDVSTDIFRLGQVIPGAGAASRALTIEPSITSIGVGNASVSRARVYAQGRGSEWITIEPSSLELPGSVTVTLKTPRSAEHGTYRGVLVVVPLLEPLEPLDTTLYER